MDTVHSSAFRGFLGLTLSTWWRTSAPEVDSPAFSRAPSWQLVFDVCVARGVQDFGITPGKCRRILRFLFDSGFTLLYSVLLVRQRMHALRKSTGFLPEFTLSTRRWTRIYVPLASGSHLFGVCLARGVQDMRVPRGARFQRAPVWCLPWLRSTGIGTVWVMTSRKCWFSQRSA